MNDTPDAGAVEPVTSGPQDDQDGAGEQSGTDPREAMRQALERKRSSSHAGAAGAAHEGVHGGPHKPAGGKRQFRRKSGG